MRRSVILYRVPSLYDRKQHAINRNQPYAPAIVSFSSKIDPV